MNVNIIQWEKIKPWAQIFVYHTRYFINCTCIEIQCLIKRSDDDIYSTDCITANVEVYIYIELIGMC